jgi:hypothetical protein
MVPEEGVMEQSHEDTFGDTGDSFCDGDPDLDSIDWGEVARLQEMEDAILALETEPERNLASVVLLAEMYGDELTVL